MVQDINQPQSRGDRGKLAPPFFDNLQQSHANSWKVVTYTL